MGICPLIKRVHQLKKLIPVDLRPWLLLIVSRNSGRESYPKFFSLMEHNQGHAAFRVVAQIRNPVDVNLRLHVLRPWLEPKPNASSVSQLRRNRAMLAIYGIRRRPPLHPEVVPHLAGVSIGFARFSSPLPSKVSPGAPQWRVLCMRPAAPGGHVIANSPGLGYRLIHVKAA